MRRALGLVVALWIVPGCGDGPACDTSEPRQTWETFGAGFMTAQCQPCHASTAPDRFGAPEDVVFDTEDDAWIWADRVLARATGEEPDMPPAGGPTPIDRERLVQWLTCE